MSSLVTNTVIVISALVCLLWMLSCIPGASPEPLPHSSYIKAHHSAITNTHRMIHYSIRHLFSIPVNPSPQSKCPPSDSSALVTVNGGVASSIPWISEFDRIMGYLYGYYSVPFEAPIYTDVFGVTDDAVVFDGVLTIDTTPPSIIDISGIVLPGTLRSVTVESPLHTYTLTVTSVSPLATPVITNGILRWSQGDLGSCVGCAVGSLIYHTTGIIVSPIALYWGGRGGGKFDTGMLFEDVISYINTHGIVYEYAHPYDVGKYPLAPPPGKPINLLFEYANSIKEVMQHIDSGTPVALEAVLSTEALSPDTMWSGIIPESGPKSSGHVMVCIGYSPKGFIVDMQWEPWWGMQGKALLPYSYFDRGLVIRTTNTR